jgi:hypothetical protein
MSEKPKNAAGINKDSRIGGRISTGAGGEFGISRPTVTRLVNGTTWRIDR